MCCRKRGCKSEQNEGDSQSPSWVDKAAIVYCFDPNNDEWKQKDSTHLCGSPAAPVEVYYELGVVEQFIFLINKFQLTVA